MELSAPVVVHREEVLFGPVVLSLQVLEKLIDGLRQDIAVQ